MRPTSCGFDIASSRMVLWVKDGNQEEEQPNNVETNNKIVQE